VKKLSTHDIAYISLGAAFICICSWISIPAEIPFTLQTFGVCLVAAVLGLRGGIGAVAVYILLGFIGAPVFSGFRGGFGVLLGTTGGYIVGFLFTAAAVGLSRRFFGMRLPALLAGMILGVAICYAFGTAWFMLVYARTAGSIGVMTALGWCVLPYIVPDIIKIAIAAVLARRIAPIVNKNDHEYEKERDT